MLIIDKYVALRKESVDRNALDCKATSGNPWSLSARRAWIEMDYPATHSLYSPVALRKESVDRNCLCGGRATPQLKVALRKESVDRNAGSRSGNTGQARRSPQGERG